MEVFLKYSCCQAAATSFRHTGPDLPDSWIHDGEFPITISESLIILNISISGHIPFVSVATLSP